MAKGANSKLSATETILKAFPGSFTYDKEIRIPFIEDGEQIQLKCVLTCAKVNVEQGGENIIPGEALNENSVKDTINIQEQIIHMQPTEEEKENIKNLMNSLGL